MPQTRCVISHGIDGTRDVGEKGTIAVVALMESLNAKEFSGVFCSGGGALPLPVDGGRVVRTRMDGPFP
jgi:hypothetical protein